MTCFVTKEMRIYDNRQGERDRGRRRMDRGYYDCNRFVVVDLHFETFISVTGDVTLIAIVPSGQVGVDIGGGEADTTAGPAGSAEMTPSGEEVGAGVSRTGV